MAKQSKAIHNLFFLSVLFLLTLRPVYANTHANNTPVDNTQTESFWMNLWGLPAPEPRLYLGMWSAHATHKRRNGHNKMIGISYGTFTAGTFVNSYYKRAFAIGIQRYWLTRPLVNNLTYQLGYRLGLVSGYKGHNLTGAKVLKSSFAIPYVQLVFGVNWKHLGWEVSAPNPFVISTGLYFRFN